MTTQANAYAEAMNCVAMVAFPKILVKVRQAEFEAGLRHSLRMILSVIKEAGHRLPGLSEPNAPRLAFLVERMLETLEREDLTSWRLSSQARSVIETAGLLPPGGWAEAEAYVESILSQTNPGEDSKG